MNNKTSFTKLILLFSLLFLIILLVLNGCKRTTITHSPDSPDSPDSLDSPDPPIPTSYNFYIENSGSMMGFFTNKESNLCTILEEYYDRVNDISNKAKGDTITLNLINTDIQPCNIDLKSFIKSAKENCTATFTKLDAILDSVMSKVDGKSVHFVISDYSFTSNDGNLNMAKSRITSLFAAKLKNKEDLSIAIFKYNCDFQGKYYPGGIICDQKIPVYIWVFGNSNQIKKITKLNIEEDSQVMVLQSCKELQPILVVKKKRMLDKSGSIIVKHWDKERHNDVYKLKFTVDMSNVSIDNTLLLSKSSYKITNGYKIESITRESTKSNIYSYCISTTKPSPGNIDINLPSFVPTWVKESNFTGIGVPPEGQTYGIEALLQGVYNAYNNVNQDIFNITIKLK